MGLFDSIKNKAMLKMAEQFASGPAFQEMVKNILNDKDGATKLAQMLKSQGLGSMVDKFKSGPNQMPMTAEQIKSMLENPMMKSMIDKMGMPTDQLAVQLAAFLPSLLEQLNSNK